MQLAADVRIPLQRESKVCNTYRCITQTLTIRLPAPLARELKANARSAQTTPSAVLGRLAADYVRGKIKSGRNALQEHIAAYAGTWDGYCSGEELMRKTRGSGVAGLFHSSTGRCLKLPTPNQ
jgi:hypothetical protein